MKVLIIETVPRPANPIDAHVRNAVELRLFLITRGHLCHIIFDTDEQETFRSDYDIILVNYGSRYLDWPKFSQLVERNKEARFGWFTNEYNLTPNGSFARIFKERGAFMLSGYEQDAVKFNYFDSTHHLNINLLLYKEFPQIEKTEGFIYWGTFRKGRQKYFTKYLNNLTHLSASPRNFKKFEHIGCRSKFIKKISWTNPVIRRFKFSLYLEDSFSHDHFTNLANRFYEALGAGCVTLFEKGCINTLERSELTGWEDFIISSKKDMQQFLKKDFDTLWSKQEVWKKIVKKNRNKMLLDVEKAFLKEAVK